MDTVNSKHHLDNFEQTLPTWPTAGQFLSEMVHKHQPPHLLLYPPELFAFFFEDEPFQVKPPQI